MYITSMYPNQAFAMGQNFQSGATAFPVSARNTIQGNTVTYSFNPLMGQTSDMNMINTGWPQIMAQNIIPTTGMNTFNQPGMWGTMAYNPYLSQQQAFSTPFINNQMSGQMGTTGISTFQSSQGMSQMRLDLHETNSDVIVAAELPNINLNDVNLTVTDDSLSISATAWAGNQTSSLFRTVALPTSIRAEQVEASYSNGILEIRAPKSDISSRRKIKINTAQ